MKMKPEHYEHMRSKIEPLDTEERRDTYRQAGLSAKRYRWNLFWHAGLCTWTCDSLYPYLNDDHVDTALRKICGMDESPEIGRKQP